MAQKVIDLYKHMLQYNDKSVYIAFHNKTAEPYFHAKQLCLLLGYSDYHSAIRDHVNKKDIFYLKDIVKNYKILYKNVQGNTKFINEAEMYSLIIKSKNKKAKEITEWITRDVMPSLRKYGEYKLNHSLKKQIDILNNLLDEKKNEIEILKHNLKKQKFKKGGMIYILRTIENTLEFNKNEILHIKFGYTKDMNKRKPSYDTCTKNKVQIIKAIYVNNPKIIEGCVIKKMEEYKIQNKKEYFETSYNKIIEEIAACIKFYEHTDIDTKPDIEEISRPNVLNFNGDTQIIVKILSDDEYDKLCVLHDESKNN